MKPVSRGLDRICVTFDEPNLVANAGMLLITTLVHRLGLESLINEAMRRVWAMGACPTERLVVDADSMICAVAGKKKQGGTYGYTKVLGLPTARDTDLHRRGAARADAQGLGKHRARGTRHFVCDLIARVRRCGASDQIVLRVDSGFWSNDTIATLVRLGVNFTMFVKTGNPAIAITIGAITEALDSVNADLLKEV